MLVPGPRNGAALLAITVVTSFAFAFAGSTDVLLYLAPALLLAIPLYFGHYIGEEQLAKLRLRSERPRQRVTRVRRLRRPIFVFIGRGGRLIAMGLAERAPPQLSLA